MRDEGPKPDESAPAIPPPAAPPYVAAWFRGRFCPLWNVERLGTLRGNCPVVKRLVLDPDPVGVPAPDDPPAAFGVPPTVRPALKKREMGEKLTIRRHKCKFPSVRSNLQGSTTDPMFIGQKEGLLPPSLSRQNI